MKENIKYYSNGASVPSLLRDSESTIVLSDKLILIYLIIKYMLKT